MVSFSRAVDESLGDLICDIFRPGDPNPANPGLAEFARDWYRRNCNREPPPPPPPPFQGGQCDCVAYNVVVFTSNRNGANQQENFQNGYFVWGPVSAINVIRQGPSANGNPDNTDWVLRVIARGNAGGPCGGTQIVGNDRFVAFTGTTPVITNIIITRANGQPDTCGSPPPPPTNYPQQPEPYPVTYDDNDGNPITINISPRIGAPRFINNNFNFPISLNISNPQTNNDYDIDIDFSFEQNSDGDPQPVSRPRPPGNRRPPDGGGGEPGRNPEDYSTPDYVEPNPDGEPDGEPEPPEEDCPATRPRPENQVRVIRGVVVSVRDPGNRASLIYGPESNGLPIFAPAVGWVQFKVSINAFQTAWTVDYPVKNQRCFIPVEWEGGAVDYAFIPNGTGVVASVTPLFGAAEVESRRDGQAPRCS